MATADEIFAQLSEPVAEHTHGVIDSDTYFIINPITRQMANTIGSKNTIMQFDHDSERFTFELPRYVEGHDMMLCNSVKVHYNNIGSEYEEAADVYDVTDLRVDPSNPDNVLCSWLISRNATQYAGILSFIVQYTCTTDNGEVVYEWYSDIYSDIEVKAGRNNGESQIIQYSDILEQWRANLFGVEDSVTANIISASETQQAEIEAKGAETLASIPEDYTTTHEMAYEALRRKSDAIAVHEPGNPVHLDDASDCNLLGLKIYGNTTQYKTEGHQVLNLYGYTDDKNSSTFSMDDNMVLTVSNNGSGPIVGFVKVLTGLIPSGIYTFSIAEGVLTYIQVGAADDYTRPIRKGENVTFEYDGTSYLRLLSADVAVGVTVRFALMLNAGSEAKSYERYTGGTPGPNPEYPIELNSIENPTIEIYNKNFIRKQRSDVTTSKGLAFDFTSAELSSVVLNGTATEEVARAGVFTAYITPGTYYVSITGLNANDAIAVRDEVSYAQLTDKLNSGDSKQFTVDKDTKVTINFAIKPGSSYSNKEVMCQIERDTLTEYKTCILQNTQLNRTLHAIPVDQNGNYTDVNRQQWICDEIDFERGKLIQRCYEYVLDGTELISREPRNNDQSYRWVIRPSTILPSLPEHENFGYCTHFGYNSVPLGNNILDEVITVYPGTGNVYARYDAITTVEDMTSFLSSENASGTPVKIVYLLKEPIETDLTSTELQAFKSLHTNATNTTILNDQNAMMNVKYVADVKRYIYKNVNTLRKFDLTLLEANWAEHNNGEYYTQTLDLDVREDVKIDLHPTAEQLIDLIQDGVSMFISNENGVATAYSVGGKPGNVTIRATETVVYYV